MLKIEITDPHLMSKAALIDIATLLMKFAGAELRSAPVPAVEPVQPFVPTPIPTNGNLPDPKMVPLSDSLLLESSHTSRLPAWAKVPVAPIDLTPNAPKTDPDLAPRPIRTDVEIDANNMPWDARIHTRTRSKNADGTWKTQRGLDPTKAADITETIKATIEPPSVIVPPPVATSGVIDWNGLMTKITGLIQQGKLTQRQVVEAVNSVGMPSLPVMPTRPDLIPAVAAYIDKMI